MNDKQLPSIFKDDSYGISETQGINGVLSRLWRTILFNLGVNLQQFNILLNENSTRFKHEFKNNRVAKIMSVSALRRALESPQMTWKVFIRGMRVLKIVKLVISVKLVHSTGKESHHEVTVDLGEPANINDYIGV